MKERFQEGKKIVLKGRKHRQTNTEATSRRDNQETHKSIEHGKAGITQKEDDTHNKNKEDKKSKIHRRHENKALAV